jgi:hypothetical protein
MIIEALDAFDDQKLTRIVGKGRLAIDNGSCQFEAIWLIGEKSSVQLSVNYDTDEITITPAVWGSEEGEDIQKLAECLDKPWGWYWFCENSQGYFDMLIISTDGPIPQEGFYSIASAISVKKFVTL